MTRQPRGLGKGLGALLGDGDLTQIRKPVEYINKSISTEAPRNGAEIMLIPVDMVEPNPFQPRMSFDNEALEELADSIRTLGLIQPVTVRRKSADRYQIISGERRFRACRMAGMHEIPAYVRETNDQGMLEMAIVENIQREDLDPIEVAMSYQRLIEECSLTQEQMAFRVGKKRASVTNYLRLLKLPAEVQLAIKEGIISMGHAKAIAGVPENKQLKLLKQCVKKGLSVRQTEELARAMTAEKPAPAPQEEAEYPESYTRLIEQFEKLFSQNISIRRAKNGGGKITIDFASDEDIENFVKRFDSL